MVVPPLLDSRYQRLPNCTFLFATLNIIIIITIINKLNTQIKINLPKNYEDWILQIIVYGYVCLCPCKTYSLQFVRLFARLPRPEDSEVTFTVFESSCHLLLPV